MYQKRNLKARVEKVQLTHTAQRDMCLGYQRPGTRVLRSQPGQGPWSEVKSRQRTEMKNFE